MRKKWLYFFIVVAIVMVVLYLWRYKQGQEFENRVPSTATNVVNVNLRQIENHLLFDFLSNPITYLKPRKKKDSIKKRKFSLSKGLSIPKNIFFYTNSDTLENNWFSSVIYVNDKEELFSYLLKEQFKRSEIDNIVFFTKANFVLVVKNEQFIIALKAKSTSDINSIVNPLFDVKEFLIEDAAILKPLMNSESDISFSFGDNIIEANFRDGILELQGSLSSNLFITNPNQTSDENGVVSLSGQINKNNTFFKQFLSEKKDKFNKFTHLSIDSIVDKWNGKLNMNIASIEHKTDTIVSYEYDDDFNKVEIKSTQEKKIPTFVLTLGQENTSSLSDYFYRKNAIQIIDKDTVFTTIPVFKFLATDTKNYLELRVNSNGNQLSHSSLTSKLNFYFNSEKYLENPLDIPLNKDQKKFLNLVKTTKLSWTEDDQFSLKIDLKDESRNFLGKLIKQ